MKNVLGNANIVQKERLGCFKVMEHKSDRSVTPEAAMKEYFMGKWVWQNGSCYAN